MDVKTTIKDGKTSKLFNVSCSMYAHRKQLGFMGVFNNLDSVSSVSGVDDRGQYF